MKKIFRSISLLLVSLSFTISSYGQLPNGSVAPDFTSTDINGVSWNLYDLLDQGKTVYIDISATWCGPCWTYHNTGKLEDLYTSYGPGGTDEVMVFFIEGDNATTLADLQGLTGGTQGDWAGTTVYPIIDNATIANNYQISYFPTIYKICPNRIITETGQTPTTAQMYALAQQCPVATAPKDVSYLNYTGTVATCGDVSMKLKIQNMGTDPLTAADITAKIGSNTVGSLAWTGNLNTYDIQEVTIGTTTITSNSTIDFTVTTTADANSSNGTASKTVNFAPVGNSQIQVHIVTDRWGAETTWEVRNDANQVLGSGGPYTNMSADGAYDQGFQTILVPSFGCYYFEISDDYGDGICCDYGNGMYEVKDGNNIMYGSGGQFGDNELKPMKVNAISGINDLTEDNNSFNIYPNPSSDVATVNFSLTEVSDVNILVTNTLGEIVMVKGLGQLSAGNLQTTLGLENLASGVYKVTLQTGSQSQTQKLSVIK